MNWASELNRDVRMQVFAHLSASNHWESLTLLTGVLSVRLVPRLQNHTHLHSKPWALHQDHAHSLKRDGVSGQLMLWCLLSKNLWVLEQRASKRAAGRFSRACLDYLPPPWLSASVCLFSIVPWLCSRETSMHILVVSLCGKLHS